MDSDKFVSTGKKSEPQNYFAEDENNFFIQNESDSFRSFVQIEPLRHLNDYDSNILKEGAYRDVNDEIFKLEYKIAKIEEELNDINKQIQLANEIYDYYHAESLGERKQRLEEDLRVLTEVYKDASLSAKISGGVLSKIKEKFVTAGKIFEGLGSLLVSYLPNKFSSILEVKTSLTKLENINKSVDELMNNRYPYGEAAEKYEQLSKYIARANSIQSEIYKFIK